MRQFRFLREPQGAAFELLLEFSLRHCPVFSVSEHEIMGWDDFGPFEIDNVERDQWRERCRLRADERRSFFRVADAPLKLLRDLGGLYQCPDDLVMHAPDGKTFFWCIAHESEGGCDPTVLDEVATRPLMEALHRLDVAPSPDATRRVAPYAFPGLGLNELRAMFERGVTRIGQPGGPQVTAENLSELQEEMQLLLAFSEYWGRRFSAGDIPCADDFRDASAKGFDLSDVVGGAAATGMLDGSQASALLNMTKGEWARGQLLGFLWIERLRDCARTDASSEAEDELLDELNALLDTPLNESSVESIYDPHGSGLSSLLFQALPDLSERGVDRIEFIAREHPRISDRIKKQLGPAIERRRQTRS